jgi:sulfoxide reductase heme-binding subunit YedZ
MSNPAKKFNLRFVLWLLLASPCVIMIVRYMTGDLYYGEFIHVTGEFSARLLMITLAATPLRLMFPKARWTTWLLQNRRYFGVATFSYAAPHLLAYLWKLASVAKIIEEGAEPGMWTGWIALVIFLALAVTSNNASVRKLGQRWKTLHRLVYLAAILTFVHWVLVAFDPLAGLLHAGVIVALETYRVVRSYAPRHRRDSDR